MSNVLYDDFKVAKKRADRAKKLFDKDKMGEIIAACKKADDGDEAGGKADFGLVCRDAIKASDDGITESELDAFIEEIWNAAWCARHGLQENKPCW